MHCVLDKIMQRSRRNKSDLGYCIYEPSVVTEMTKQALGTDDIDTMDITVVINNCDRITLCLLRSLDITNIKTSFEYCVPFDSMYDKWLLIFNDLIIENDPTLDSKFNRKSLVELLYVEQDGELPPSYIKARDYAEYMIPMFMLTYREVTVTATLRQWYRVLNSCRSFTGNYICEDDDIYSKDNCQVTYFEKKLYESLIVIEQFLSSILIDSKVSESGYFDVLTNYSGVVEYSLKNFTEFDTYLGLTYTWTSEVSLKCFLNLIMSGKFKNYMMLEFSNPEFYVPDIIRGTEYEQEWLSDLESIENIMPFATKVKIIELGVLSTLLEEYKNSVSGEEHEFYASIISSYIDNYNQLGSCVKLELNLDRSN